MSGTRRLPLTWYTKPNCGLCDAAWPHVRRAAELLRLELRSVDVSTDEGLTARYGTRIPVLALGADVLAEGRISPWQAWRAVLGVRVRR